ncbi:MAG: FHA domain-containing protein [Pirellulaceae bacterium]|nr:FHA domain-containing protein [Pirellulaceae bacterium]
MICVLDIIDGPARGKRFWVKQNQCIEVGRISTADFSIPLDSHMSRRHLLLDSTQNCFRVRDVGSANGTFLNNDPVQVSELRAGDRIRAGMTTFLVSYKNVDENPHDCDGISFGQSIAREPSEPNNQETFKSLVKSPGTRSVDFSGSVDKELIADLKRNTVQPSDLENIDLAATQLNIASGDWWQSYFTPTNIAEIYEQSAELSGLCESFVGLLEEFSKSFKLYVVVNQSQLSQDSFQLVERLKGSGKLEGLSQTLYFAKQSELEEFWDLIKACQGQDAMICLGSRTPLHGKELMAFIDTLSFPSMLRKNLTAQSNSLKKQILHRIHWVMFESDLAGRLMLLLKS